MPRARRNLRWMLWSSIPACHGSENPLIRGECSSGGIAKWWDFLKIAFGGGGTSWGRSNAKSEDPGCGRGETYETSCLPDLDGRRIRGRRGGQLGRRDESDASLKRAACD